MEIPEVCAVQVVPSEEVRIVPEKPTTTKVLFPYATALRLFDVPEVCAVQVVPSDEVSKVPEAPTAINNPLDVVLLLLSSLFLAQEMTVRLKSEIRIKCKKKIYIVLLISRVYSKFEKSHVHTFGIRNSE